MAGYARAVGERTDHAGATGRRAGRCASTEQHLRALQRTAGNAAVAALLGGTADARGQARGPVPVQRTLRATSERWNPIPWPTAFFGDVQTALENLTARGALVFPTHRNPFPVMTVGLAPGGAALAANHPAGWRLVRQIVGSPRAVTIVPAAGGQNRMEPRRGWFQSARAAMAAAATPGAGTSSTVFWDAAAQPLAPVADATAPRGWDHAPTPEWLALGHELGHADRAARGAGAYDLATGNHVLGSFLRPGGGTLAAVTEEIENIGLPVPAGANANPNPNANANANANGITITENDLRNEHQLARRVGYTSA